MAKAAPFDKFEWEGCYLAAVLAAAANNGDLPSALIAMDAYAPTTGIISTEPLIYPPVLVLVNQFDLIVVIGGTPDSVAWVYNVLGSPQATFAGVPGAVAAFFFAVALNTQNNVGATIIANAPGRKVTYIGYSHGGAAALILYQRLLPQISSPCQVYTLGCPRTGNPTFALAFGIDKVFRIENLDDPIPSLPPEKWLYTGSHYPVPGVPPVATYTNPGVASTLNYQGYLSPGSTPTFTQAIVNALQGTQPVLAHQAAEYVRRLGLQKPSFEDQGGGADWGPVEVAATDTLIDPSIWEISGMAAYKFPAANKVEVFYLFQGAGFSEIWYSNTDPQTLVSTTIPNYVTARLALATSGCRALYARVTVIGAPRQVQFWVPGYTVAQPQGIKGGGSVGNPVAFPTSYNGTYSGPDVQPQQALLVRLRVGNFWTRMFLHAFPQEVITPGFYAPTPSFIKAFAKYKGFLMGAASGWFGVTTVPNTPSSRIWIQQITANPGRGATVLYYPPGAGSQITPPVVGQPVQIGGAGAAEFGMNGRKIVTNLVPATAGPPPTNPGIVIGGISPIGAGPQPNQAYFYPITFNGGGLADAQVERLTTHKIGKPIFEPAGRRRLTIPLRR